MTQGTDDRFSRHFPLRGARTLPSSGTSSGRALPSARRTIGGRPPVDRPPGRSRAEARQQELLARPHQVDPRPDALLGRGVRRHCLGRSGLEGVDRSYKIVYRRSRRAKMAPEIRRRRWLGLNEMVKARRLWGDSRLDRLSSSDIYTIPIIIGTIIHSEYNDGKATNHVTR